MRSLSLDQIIERLTALSLSEVNEVSKDWVFVVMALFRQHLEQTAQGKQYKILMFYCNWLLHVELDKGIVQDMLIEMSVVIDDPTKGHPSDRISEIISLSKLRSEIILLLKNDANINCGMFDIYSNWIAFSELFFPFILNKPLVKKPSTSTLTNYWVEKLELYDNSARLGWKITVNPGNMQFSHYVYRTDPKNN
jgi:hypothetical protein